MIRYHPRSADLYHHHVIAFGRGFNRLLDFIGNVGNYLHSSTEVITAAFLGDHIGVDTPCSEIIKPAHAGTDKALVVPQIEIGFGTIARYKYFAMLEWAHRAGIDIDVGIELDQSDLEAASLKHSGKRSGGDAFSQRGNHTTGDKYE